ncbi:DUF7931 domain-containing protein [Pseudomonas sp. Marseille-QA0892]
MTSERDRHSSPDLPPITFDSPGSFPRLDDSSGRGRSTNDKFERTGIHTRAEAAACVQAFLQQARRTVCIYSQDLEPWLYDTEACTEACKALLTRQHRSRLRILVRDAERVRSDHRLVRLSHRLTSNFAIRRLNPDYAFEPGGFLIVDDGRLFTRPIAAEPTGKATTGDRASVRQFQARFDQAWDYSIDDPNLRSIFL